MMKLDHTNDVLLIDSRRQAATGGCNIVFDYLAFGYNTEYRQVSVAHLRIQLGIVQMLLLHRSI